MATKQSLPEFDFTKLLADFKMPGVDMEAIAATQRKNFEAFVKANQLAVEGIQAVGKRQAEIIKQTFEEASSAVKSALDQLPPDQKVAKQTELAKVAFEKGLANARELAELVAKSNREAFDVINQRVAASLDEMKDLVAKTVK